MTILTDDLIEKGARAIYPIVQENTGCIADEKECTACILVARAAARAVLECALPDVVDAIGEATPEIKCLRTRLEAAPGWAQAPGTNTASMVLKAERSGHVAGLKEALEIVDRHRKGWTVSAATAGLVAEVMKTASEILSEAITARIAELEKGSQ